MKKKAIIIVLLTISIALFSQNLTMEVENSYVSVGEWTTFTVTVTGDFESIKYSDEKDIILTQTGNRSSLSIINGKRTKSYILNYRVQALKEGTIELPTFFAIDKHGDKVESEKATIYVTKLKDDTITNHNTNAQFESPYVKLYIDIPDRNIYIGEAIPVKVIAYFSTRYQPGIQRSPYIKTGSFILDSSDKYKNDTPGKIINGEEWLQISWNSFLTPLKAGEVNLEVAIESYIEKSGGSRFFSSGNREDIKTSTNIKTFTIKPLPTAGRPDSFTGAIGEFEINSSLDITEAKVGDPLTLTIDIFGSGNFQRISMPKLDANDENWKLYPESSTYKGSNKSNYKGVKNFQQILSPKNINIKKLSPFKFSYFNPVKEEYIELSTDEILLDITQGEFQDKELNEIIDSRFSEQKEIMRHLKKENNTNYQSIKKNNYFYISIILSALLLLATLILIFIRYKKENSTASIIKKQNSIISEITKAENANEFIRSLSLYRDLIRESEANLRSINPSSITSADLANSDQIAIFTTIDELNYSTREILEEEYNLLTKNIIKELKC